MKIEDVLSDILAAVLVIGSITLMIWVSWTWPWFVIGGMLGAGVTAMACMLYDVIRNKLREIRSDR